MLRIVYEGQFKKDYKLAQKRGKNISKLTAIINLLINEEPLPPKNRNHRLTGNWNNAWECHIEPDWLLIYEKSSIEIILVRTGTHSDLF